MGRQFARRKSVLDHISDVKERQRRDEIAPVAKSSDPVSGQPYACQIKRFGFAGNVVVPTSNFFAIDFSPPSGFTTSVYFENQNGTLLPPVGAGSMFDPASPHGLTIPVAGEWGYFFAYAWQALPFPTYTAQAVFLSGGNLGTVSNAREANSTIFGAYGHVSGTCWAEVGDFVFPRVWQESGSDQQIFVDSSQGLNDEWGSGPILSVWLIAPGA